jgi:hypothetical protein
MSDSIASCFKTPLIKERSLGLHPLTLMILADAVHWARVRGLPASITETVTTAAEDKALNRVSDSHAEGRAFDMSTRGWDEESIAKFTEEFSKRYGAIAAFGKSGNPALIVRHDSGRGDHFHIQIAKKFQVQVRA